MVSLLLKEAGTTELLDGLHSEEFDAAFVRSPVADPQGLSECPLLEEQMFVALPNDHPLAPSSAAKKEKPLAVAELASEPFILYRRRTGPGFYDLIIAACHEAGFTPQITQEASRVLSTLNLVAAGLGVSVVPESFPQLQISGVAYRSIEGSPRLVAPLNLACRPVNHSAAARHFVAMARHAAGHFKETVVAS
jgi:DNA-binding transcriptional LysR family regulator